MCTTAVTFQRVVQCTLRLKTHEMIRAGVRCESMIGLPDEWRRVPRIRLRRLSLSEKIGTLDICIYLFPEGRAGLSQAVNEMSSTDQTKFCVFDPNYEEEIIILLVKAGCHGDSPYDAIGNLKTIVSTLFRGSYWVPRSVMDKIFGELPSIEMRFFGYLCHEFSPRELGSLARLGVD